MSLPRRTKRLLYEARQDVFQRHDPPSEARNTYGSSAHVELVMDDIDLRMNGILCSGMTLRKAIEKGNAFHKLPSSGALIHLSIFTISFTIGLICTNYVNSCYYSFDSSVRYTFHLWIFPIFCIAIALSDYCYKL